MAIYCSRRMQLVFATLALIALQNTGAAAADSPATAGPSVSPPVADPAKWPDCASLDNGPAARASVFDAYRLTPEVRRATANGQAPENVRQRKVSLGDEVVIEVNNLDNLLRHRACTETPAARKSIVLYLDERPLLAAVADPPVDPQRSQLIFPLDRTEKSREVWTKLLGAPQLGPRRVAVSLGIEDEFAIASNKDLDLEVIPKWLAFWLLLAFIVLATAFWRLSMKSGLLRDSNSPVSAGSEKPWSLSRVQAAWWFFIILVAYVFIGIVTGDFSTSITGTSLVLLGIASGTTLTSTVIDKSKDTPDQQALEAAAQARLEGEVTALEQLPATADEKIAKLLAAKRSQLSKLRGRNEQFFIDILSDANGVSFHRFQIATWTVVLGGVFVWAVYRDLAMPQFSNTLLGLMGLSAGTFVAMKNTEARTPKA